MPAKHSRMLALGTKAPSFTLPDPDGTLFSIRDDAPATLVMFICNHCPFVVHIRDQIAQIGKDYGAQDVAVFAINSNDVATHPADHPRFMKQEALQHGYLFPYLYDEDQSAAKAYQAACTPDFFVFNNEQELVYRGQLDDSRPGNSKPVNGSDLRAALDAVLAGRDPSAEQTPSIGCSIKWRPGNEPDYA